MAEWHAGDFDSTGVWSARVAGEYMERRKQMKNRIPNTGAMCFFALILALVLIESMALYTFAIVFLKVK